MAWYCLLALAIEYYYRLVLLIDETKLFPPQVIMMICKLNDTDLDDVKNIDRNNSKKIPWDWVFAFHISNALWTEQRRNPKCLSNARNNLSAVQSRPLQSKEERTQMTSLQVKNYTVVPLHWLLTEKIPSSKQKQQWPPPQPQDRCPPSYHLFGFVWGVELWEFCTYVSIDDSGFPASRICLCEGNHSLQLLGRESQAQARSCLFPSKTRMKFPLLQTYS